MNGLVLQENRGISMVKKMRQPWLEFSCYAAALQNRHPGWWFSFSVSSQNWSNIMRKKRFECSVKTYFGDLLNEICVFCQEKNWVVSEKTFVINHPKRFLGFIRKDFCFSPRYLCFVTKDLLIYQKRLFYCPTIFLLLSKKIFVSCRKRFCVLSE